MSEPDPPTPHTCAQCAKKYKGADDNLRCRITGNKVQQHMNVKQWCREFEPDDGRTRALCWITTR